MKHILFQQHIRAFYAKHARAFPWRSTTDPYHILVSEFMLQQTQTTRVLDYYPVFLRLFPTLSALAGSRQKDVLAAWQGLGYNRRALYLQQAAKTVLSRHGGEVPSDMEGLLGLPGVGMSTAGAVMAFAFNLPAVFIETNIRRVYIHFFFQEKSRASDAEILPLIEMTLYRDNPRHWYYALMDYGAMLKAAGPNPNRKSTRYARQARFADSDRQVRGRMIRELLEKTEMSRNEMLGLLGIDAERAEKIMHALEREGFLACSEDAIRLL